MLSAVDEFHEMNAFDEFHELNAFDELEYRAIKCSASLSVEYNNKTTHTNNRIALIAQLHRVTVANGFYALHTQARLHTNTHTHTNTSHTHCLTGHVSW